MAAAEQEVEVAAVAAAGGGVGDLGVPGAAGGVGGAQQRGTEVERPVEAEEAEIVSAELWRCLRRDSRRAATIRSAASSVGERPRLPPTKAAPAGAGQEAAW